MEAPEICTAPNGFFPNPSEQKLIEALSVPENRGKTITDICAMISVSRTVYYEAIKKPGFLAFLRQVQVDMIKSYVGPVIQAVYNFAVSDPKCHQDRRLLLEMAGVYQESKKLEIEDVTPARKLDLSTLSNEELAKFREVMNSAEDIKALRLPCGDSAEDESEVVDGEIVTEAPESGG
jgi:hypothetical protein